jgi:hypothetical protein
MKVLIVALSLFSTAALAVDCPPQAKSCKYIVLTPEQEETLKALIAQTGYSGPYIQIKSAIDFYLDAIAKAPAGEVKEAPK